ncbi:MAG: hypothetical protein MSC43_02450 [Clostridiales bacterium]|nr:hypothetical protein [Clostridiales bacterium]
MTDAERQDLRFDADADLRQYREAQKNITHYRDKIERLRARANSTTQELNPNRIFIQHDDATGADIILTIIDMQHELWDKMLKAESLCLDLEHKISAWTEGIEVRILRSYYLYGQSLKQIATDEGYSYKQIKRFRWRALENYGKKLKKYCEKD